MTLPQQCCDGVMAFLVCKQLMFPNEAVPNLEDDLVMKRIMNRTNTLTTTLLVFGLASLAQANLLDDGSFDLAPGGDQTSNSAWTLNVNFPDAQNPGDASAQFQAAPWASNDAADPQTGVWFRSFTGKPGQPELADADITQMVAAPADGDYTLSFDARREDNFMASSWSVLLSSSGGGMASSDLLASAPADGSWNSYTINLSGVSAGDMLTVSGAMVGGVDAGTNPQSGMLDNFDLERVPEPSSVALAALGMIALLTIRRKR